MRNFIWNLKNRIRYRLLNIPGRQFSDNEYWTKHVVTMHQEFSSAKESLEYFHWRNSQYLFYDELMPCSGFDDCIILDYGCGPGNDIVGFIECSKPKRVIGMDVSPTALKQAKERVELHRPEIPVELALIKDGADPLPFDDDSIDYIHSSGVLHHIPGAALEKILKEFCRVLKPSGKFRAMVYNYYSLHVHLYVAYHRQIVEGMDTSLPLEEAFRRSTDGVNCPTSRYYRAEDFMEICSDAGFRSKYLGAAVSVFEMDYLPERYKAIYDPRLRREQRDFLMNLRFDEYGRPLHNGHVAGYDACFEMTK